MMWNDLLFNTTGILFLVTIFFYVLSYVKTPKNLPPGPMGKPYLGYMPFLGSQPHIKLKKLSEKYGSIMTFFLGSDRVVVLSSFKLIKEAFMKQGDVYAERPESFQSILRLHNEGGLFASVGAPMVELRRFALSTLRNFGMGKFIMESKIQDEIDCLIKEIKKFNGKPANLHDLLGMSIFNVIYTIAFGRRNEYDDKDFQEVLQLSIDYAKSIGIDQWSQFLPQFIVKLLGITQPKYFGYLLYDKLLEEIIKHNKTSQGNDEEDFTSAWKLQSEKSDSRTRAFYDRKLSTVLVELIAGGRDTMSTTLEITLYYLIKYPKVQAKVQEEIDKVIGKNRTPTMSDLKLMPYTEATIMEIGRITTITPLAIPHSVRQDTMLEGYLIPKGSTILGNLWAVHRDPEIFPEPDCFKPERFLTEDNKIKYIESFIPFGIGKMQCVGEALARMEVFLYTTNLLQHFTFCKEGEVSVDCDYSIIVEPKHQKINAIVH